MGAKSSNQLQAADALNTAQRIVSTPRGDYLIQVSWPLGWSLDETPDVTDVPVVYLVDGNAYFFSATEIVRRLQVMHKKAVVVGIGYPTTDGVFVPERRVLDFSPPSKKGYSPPPADDGTPQDPASFGGAEEFHQTLESVLIPLVQREILPTVPLKQMRSVLFGHSLGGLFALYSLFSRPGFFDTYIAASPSIWLNGAGIVDEQEQDFLRGNVTQGLERKPRLYFTYGLQEHEIVKKPYESDERFEQRLKDHAKYRLGLNAVEMAARLEASHKLEEVWLQALDGEDHLNAAVTGLQRALTKVLGEWAG